VTNNKKFRVGILGCGWIAATHAKAILEIPDYQLAAFCDSDRSRAEQFQKEYGRGSGEIFTEHAEMFKKSDLDVVTICLPPFAHTDEVEHAAQHSCHIMMEKPIALNLEKAQSMVEAVTKNKIHSQVGFVFRFLDIVERVKALTESGKGPAIQYTGRYLCNALHSPWWRERSKSGGQLVEQVIHQIDLSRYLLGKPKQVFAYTDNLAHKEVERYSIEDVSGTLIRFESGAIAVIAGTNCAIPNEWKAASTLCAKGFTANWAWGENASQIVHTDRMPVMTETLDSTKNVFLAEHLDLLSAIKNGHPTRTPMSEGYETLKLVLGAYQSSETGLPVNL
jgi:predicted dehydrogenase